MKMMTELDDDPEWYTTNDIDETDDSDANYIVGEQAMDRLARSLGGKHIIPITFQILPGFLSSALWTERHAGLMCISAMAEGCVKVMEGELSKLVDLIIPHILQDQHARVRYAACNAIGQMCTDFGPLLQRHYHDKVVTAFCSAMDFVDQPR
jgi:hypothetical protein